jgi:hypothetical protein
MVLAVVGGLWLFDNATRDTEPAITIATSCGGFEADANKLFDKGDSAALSGTFAPGDHVHLAIDFNGVGYSWKLTGVLGAAEKKDVTGSSFDSWTTTIAPTADRASSTVTRGKISGFARLELEIDVTAAGDGAITINKSSVPLVALPKVARASCTATRTASTRPTT